MIRRQQLLLKNPHNFKNRYKKSLSSKSGSSALKESKSKASEESRQDQRFRLVAQKRALKLDELEEWPSEAADKKETPKSEEDSEDKELFHLYDVDLVEQCNGHILIYQLINVCNV